MNLAEMPAVTPDGPITGYLIDDLTCAYCGSAARARNGGNVRPAHASASFACTSSECGQVWLLEVKLTPVVRA